MKIFADNLRSRLTAAFVLNALIFGVVVITGTDLVLESMEEAYANNRLRENMSTMERSVRRGEPVLPPRSQSLRGYVFTRGTPVALPPHLVGLAPGMHESAPQGREIVSLVRDVGKQRLILSFDVSELDSLETEFEFWLSSALLITVFFSGVAGVVLAARIVQPLSALAQAVDALGDSAAVLPPPASGQAREIMQLHGAFHRYSRRLREHSDRERQFTGDVSHELRHPVMAASNALELLAMSPALDEPGVEQVSRARRAMARMSTLVHVFLTLAREPEQSADDTAHNVDLRAVAEHSVARFAESAKARGLTLELAASSSLTTQCDGDMAAVVVDNLIDNAIKYTPHGGVTVEIDTEAIRVHDTGPGIDAAATGDGRAATSSSGTRLGLSIVERLCARHGWRLQLDSKDGVGTCASIIVKARPNG